ncbi:LOW QUALITY PROTEIN: style cell-cycle inhibitor 1-A [Actinidia eriantha]|uniref:LOW QUALITY PROTEIN: style cell-cycle inhibitor 1-A n=1 Tax=Actinidia eriantha TaxID=165200 RepID=UPI002585A446|nr:LOW QUALITY PROTEIN: style cell-cycle inhibitor 1-A [Actinidia eriantha]
MGSDEKRKKKTSSLYDSEEEGKSKRRRSAKEEVAKSSKSEKRDKDKKKSKSHKSSKHPTDGEKKSKEKRRSKRDKHDGQFKLKFQELSSDDYFAKNNEFATWLKEEKNVFFSDLSSESARDLFSQFVKDWNSHKLESRYYEGIETGPRTAHKWKIKQ